MGNKWDGRNLYTITYIFTEQNIYLTFKILPIHIMFPRYFLLWTPTELHITHFSLEENKMYSVLKRKPKNYLSVRFTVMWNLPVMYLDIKDYTIPI